MDKKKIEERETSLHIILSGLLLNGYICACRDKKINYEVLEFAKKEIKKLYG